MTNIIPMLMTYLMMTQTRAQDIDSNKTTVNDVEYTALDATSYIISTACSNLKLALGLEYKQLAKRSAEPDLSQLTIEYIITNEVTVSINLTSAAKWFTSEEGYYTEDYLFLYVHGFTDDPSKESFETIRNSFVAKGLKVLALDCSSLIGWLYLRSTTYVRFIGEMMGEVLAAIVSTGVIDSSKIHLIGHSLGAHICSFTGKQFYNLTGELVGRISGLDPAGPCFSELEKGLRLNATDAVFVDAIHTNGGIFGMQDPVGHVDFYPNGGTQQPGCVLPTCSHSRVWVLFAESVNNSEAFLGVQCEDYDQFQSSQCSRNTSLMGYACPPDTRGLFFLETAGESPYGLGEEGIKFNNASGA